MKKYLYAGFAVFIAIVQSTAAPLSVHGNVVSGETKAWAGRTAHLSSESNTLSASNDIGILYFENQTDQPYMDILQKGISLLLTHDLKKLQKISVVSREKVEALLAASGIQVAELGKMDVAIKMGEMLNTAYVINGRIHQMESDAYSFQANIIHVRSQATVGRVSSRGKLFSQLRTMEKDLLFKITQAMDIQMNPKEKNDLEQALTQHDESLRSYLEAVEKSDREQYAEAARHYAEALRIDPDNQLAASAIQELIDLGLVVAETTATGEVEAYSEPVSPSQPGVESGGSQYDIRNPEDREPESALVSNTLESPVEVEIEEDSETNLSNVHTSTGATWDMAVDSATLQTALDQTAQDSDLLVLTENRNTIPGTYSAGGSTLGFPGTWISGDTGVENIYGDDTSHFGLQTLGQNGYTGTPTLLLNASTLEAINQNGFLAYAVQVEEDRLNKKIIEMHDNQLIQNALYTSEKYKGIRDRDAWLTQRADAQAGRVLRDANGNWVRVQQYILRPDTETVQLLNVSLRGGSSNLAGLSTMNWTTTFSEGYTGDLRNLPWGHWLNTQEIVTGDETIRFVSGAAETRPPLLRDMKITFTNPDTESLSNHRTFADSYMNGSSQYQQEIIGETLQVQAEGIVNTYQHTQSGSPAPGEFSVQAGSSATNGFSYIFGDQSEHMDIQFRVLGDGDTLNNRGERIEYRDTVSFNDMWDAMRVNEFGSPNIGNNNLEIQIDPQMRFYQSPIDTIYIPMSRMVWKQEPSFTNP